MWRKEGFLAQDITFARLALNVNNFPEGYDASGLNRMVQYAIDYPRGKYICPKQYDELLAKIGGSIEVKLGVQSEAIARTAAQVKYPAISLIDNLHSAEESFGGCDYAYDSCIDLNGASYTQKKLRQDY